jgi:predicted kinase
MRKWMRDRLQGRKKKAAEPSDQPTPPPLQPAYFDAGQEDESASESSPPEAAAVAEFAVPHEDAEEGGEAESTEADSGAETAAKPARTAAREAAVRDGSARDARGRRRRGGRGRGGRGREQAVAAAFAPAAVKGSIPLGDGDAVEDESPSAPAEAPHLQPVAQTAQAPLVPAATPPAPTQVPPPQPAPRGVVVLAIGLPGSGKSSWFKRHNVVALSSDMVRSLLFDDVREQRFQDLVFSNLRSMLKARLIAKRPMNYVDATNLTPQERQHWIKLAKDYRYEVHAVFFDVPLEVCLERHQRRDRVVPEDVMRRMAAKLKPPAFEEGFAKITVVRVKKKAEGANGGANGEEAVADTVAAEPAADPSAEG